VISGEDSWTSKDVVETAVRLCFKETDFGRKFDLEHIASKFESTEYEPEVFPGLVFRLDDPKAVLLLFVSGKGVCAGVNNMRDVNRAAQKINKILQRH